MISFALPLTFASLLGGALADRLAKRQVLLLSQGGYFLMVLTVATLDYTGIIRFWHLIVIGFINGTMAAFNMPSRNSMISEIVPESDLMNAISLNSSGMNLTRIIGPALAGVLIIFIDTAGVFYLIALINAVAILFTLLISKGDTPEGMTGKGVAADIIDGFKYAKNNPILMGLVIISFVPALFGFPYIALLPAWSREALNAQSDGLGLLIMVMGMGSLVGTLTLASIKRFRRRRLFQIANGFIWGLALFFFSRCFTYTSALPFLFLVGFVSSVFMALNMTLMQVYSSAEMRGRILSMGMMTFGIMPLSALPFGALAERIGTPGSLQIAGIILCFFMVIFYFAYPGFRDAPRK
jgi:MFS family permease